MVDTAVAQQAPRRSLRQRSSPSLRFSSLVAHGSPRYTEWRRAGCAPELGAWSWSLGWGAIGTAVGIQTTLLIGAAGLLVAGFIMHRIKLPAGDADMVPSNHWPEPLVAEPFCP